LGCAVPAADAAALGAVACDGAAAGAGVVACRCMPADLPPPNRLLAASASPKVRVQPSARMAARSEKLFIDVSYQ
jgi:hypothetical protein